MRAMRLDIQVNIDISACKKGSCLVNFRAVGPIITVIGFQMRRFLFWQGLHFDSTGNVGATQQEAVGRFRSDLC
jgi:hypothetical protein